MHDLTHLLTEHAYPAALDRVRRSFARQPDLQTCGASAIRHGLLLGGLTIPTATLETLLGIRTYEGTTPEMLRSCLAGLGLDAEEVVKPSRMSTTRFLDSLRGAFGEGGFLIPCVRKAAHWVCVGAWEQGRVGVVDSYFSPSRPKRTAKPGLGFHSLTVEELDALDWAHHITLVRPGVWAERYDEWLPARATLLRLKLPHREPHGRVSLVGAIRHAAHQFLDAHEYGYGRLRLRLRTGSGLTVYGGEAVGVETVGPARNEVLVVRRLGMLSGQRAAPEVVVRASALCGGQLAG
jgi:hypothetical protein